MSDFNEHTAPAGWPHHRRPVSTAPGELPAEAPAVAHGLSLGDAIDAFLLNRRVGNCTARTLDTYDANLHRFARASADDVAACTPLAVQQYLTRLRERMKPITVHQHFRCLRTFFAWATELGLLLANPLRGLVMKAPTTLPRVPESWEIIKLLNACRATWEGTRDRTLITLLADSALRISEALRLRVEDVRFNTQTLVIRQGKGQRDGVGHFGQRTAEQLRVWLIVRGDRAPEDLLFCTREGRPLTRTHALHLLHRLSVRAGLPRKVGPHALRHYAATAILRRTGDLELVRRVLRHETLAMSLRYAILTGADVASKFARASPLDHLQRGG